MIILWSLAASSFVGFLISLWFRDRQRKALCRAADAFMKESQLRDQWIATYQNLLQSTGEMRRVSLLRRNAEILPQILRGSLRRYTQIRWIPVFFLFVMVLAGLASNVIHS